MKGQGRESLTQENSSWTQSHLLSSLQRACTDISLTGRWLLSSHCIIVSFLDGLATCPDPELHLKCQWKLSSRMGLYRWFLSFNCHQEKIKTIWATKDEFFFSVTKTALSDPPTQGMMSKGAWCPWLSFTLSSIFSVGHYLTFTRMCLKDSLYWESNLWKWYCDKKSRETSALEQRGNVKTYKSPLTGP